MIGSHCPWCAQVLREVVVAPLVEETISAVQNERRSTPAAASRSGSSTDGFTQVVHHAAHPDPRMCRL